MNVLLDLPIDRCSVDHGTAFDTAGKNIVNHTNMLPALSYASKMVTVKRSRNCYSSFQDYAFGWGAVVVNSRSFTATSIHRTGHKKSIRTLHYGRVCGFCASFSFSGKYAIGI